MMTYIKGKGWVEETVQTLYFNDYIAVFRAPEVGERFTYVAADNKDPEGWVVNDRLNETRIAEWFNGWRYTTFANIHDGRDLEKYTSDIQGYWQNKGLTTYFITILPLDSLP